jgi:hypothetical protein
MRVAAIALSALLSLCGCDDSNVAVCFSTTDAFCNVVAVPVADAGPDQNVVAGDIVVLDGSDSRSGLGGSLSYAWTQTGGASVALVDANQAKASFVAPDVASDAVLTFRLTVIDSAHNADSNDTRVTVAPASAVMVALRLFDGPLRPAAPWPQGGDECPSATDALPADAAAAQLGLWLAGRTLAIVKGLDGDDPSQWLDFVRLLIAERPAATADTAGQIETFGFVLFASGLAERDPALQQAIGTRLAGARMLDDPAALLASRARVRSGGNGIAIDASADPRAVLEAASERLLAARSGCPTPGAALDLTAAAFAVIAAAE